MGTLEGEISRLGKKLEINYARNDLPVCIGALAQLEKIKMTVDLLRKTGIGKQVNTLRKRTRERKNIASSEKKLMTELYNRCEHLVAAWQQEACKTTSPALVEKNMVSGVSAIRRLNETEEQSQSNASAERVLSSGDSNSNSIERIKRVKLDHTKDLGEVEAVKTKDAGTITNTPKLSKVLPQTGSQQNGKHMNRIVQENGNDLLKIKLPKSNSNSSDNKRDDDSIFARIPSTQKGLTLGKNIERDDSSLKSAAAIPTLQELCIKLIRNMLPGMKKIPEVSPMVIMPALIGCNSTQLERLERYNPFLIGNDDQIWAQVCSKELHLKEPINVSALTRAEIEAKHGKGMDPSNSCEWRLSFYKKKNDEQERLERISASIRAVSLSQELQRGQSQIKHLPITNILTKRNSAQAKTSAVPGIRQTISFPTNSKKPLSDKELNLRKLHRQLHKKL